MSTRHVKVQNKEKYFHIKITKQKCQFNQELTIFSSIFFLIGFVFSICRKKMNVHNPSEMDIKKPYVAVA